MWSISDMMKTSKYRVYAKIIGYILPQTETKIGDCFISGMTEKEQRDKNFSPLSVKDPESIIPMNYRSFLINRLFVV